MIMAELFGTYFPLLVLGSMLFFMIVLGSVSIEDALRGRRL
jgi:hypothetical protein